MPGAWELRTRATRKGTPLLKSVQGALACKMLSWEDPLVQQLRALRATEARHLFRMKRIWAINMSIQVRRYGGLRCRSWRFAACPHASAAAGHVNAPLAVLLLHRTAMKGPVGRPFAKEQHPLQHAVPSTRVRPPRAQFMTTVLITFATFTVYRARNGTLQVASVFYGKATCFGVRFLVVTAHTHTG